MKYRMYKGILRMIGVLILSGLLGVMPASAKSRKNTLEKPTGKITEGIIEYYKGDLSFLKKMKDLEKIEKGTTTFKSDKTLFSGKLSEKKSLSNQIKQANKHKAVIRINKQLYVSLSGGSGLSYETLEDGTVNLFLTGNAHIFTHQKKQLVKFALHGAVFSTKSAHFYLTNEGKASQLVLLEGAATLKGMFANIPKGEKKGNKTVGKKAVSSPQKEKKGNPVPDSISKKMKTGMSVLFGKTGLELVKPPKYNEKLYISTLVPGISLAGEYRFVGLVEFPDSPLQIIRFGKELALDTSPALISRGDIIKTGSDQTAILNFFNKDKIRLFAKTRFTIEEYPEKTVNKPVQFGFLGKIRAKITKRKKFRRMFFKAATAIIGIKGTEFETSSGNQVMDVKTVEGTVGVTDPDGKGEVLVNAGQQTKVEAGKLPEKPQPIPANELKRLGAVGLVKNSILEIRDLTIKEGAVYQSVRPDFKVMPKSAPYEVLIDGRLQKEFVAGTPLKNLKDGVHTITIKGVKPDLYTFSVKFTIDTQKPALEKDSGLKAIVIKEGDPLTLKWKEKIKELVIGFDSFTMKGTLSSDKMTASLNSSLLFQTFKKKTDVSIKVKATDLAGNITDLVQPLMLRFKPEKNPLLEVVEANKMMVVNAPVEIAVKSDRELEKWSVKLNGKVIPFMEKQLKQKKGKAVKKSDVKKEGIKEIIVPLHTLKTFKEGKHILVVEGKDDFNMKGTLVFEFEYDKTQPTLVPPVQLLGKVGPEDRILKTEKLLLKEGEAFHFNWSEPVLKPILKLGSKILKLKIDPKTQAVVLSSAELKNILKKEYSGKYQLKVFDTAGNPALINGKLDFKIRSQTPPKLKIGDGKKSILVQALSDIKVQSSDMIFNWKVQLDGSKLKPKENKPFPNGKELTISKHLPGKLKDGTYQLKISGVDGFDRPVVGTLIINVDSTPPEVDKSTLGFRLNKIQVKAKQRVMVIWNEKISLSKALLDGDKWNLENYKDGKTIIIFGDTKRLNYKLKNYLITVRDAAGNETSIRGGVAIQKPRTTALKDNYKGTILYRSDDVTDKVILSNRLPFSLNESTAGKVLKNKRGFKAIYKARNEYRLNEILDEPLINSYRFR